MIGQLTTTRKKTRLAATAGIAAAAFCTLAGVARADIMGEYTLVQPMAKVWTAPPSADVARVWAEGAQGGAFVNADGSRIAGGLGGSASGWLVLTPSESLNIWVGGPGADGGVVNGDANGCFLAGRQGGWPAGGPSGDARTSYPLSSCFVAGGGGRASGVWHLDNSPVLIAAGGGGASVGAAGGDGGGLVGVGGSDRATGGGQDGGGQPGWDSDCGCSRGASAGTQTSGGGGGSYSLITGTSGGGGGQGWWGGGGGATGSGAGGSSYLADELTTTETDGGARAGSGLVDIAYGVADVPVVTADTPPHATAGSAFSYTFQASGWPAPTWSLEYGALPPGLNLSPDGKLDGTTTRAGTYWFTLLAANPLHSTEATVKLVVDAAVARVISPGPPQTTLANTDFPNTINARVLDAYGNGVPGVALHFALPSGATATFNSNGTTSTDATTDAYGSTDVGTVAAGSNPGPMTLTISAPGSGLADAEIDLTVDAPAAFGDAAPPSATVGQQYTYTVPTTGYPAPTVSLAGGSLPPGLALADDGTISGTPTQTGNYSITLQADNGIGQPAQKPYTLAVTDAGTPKLSIHAASTAEGNTGTTPLRFLVTLNHVATSPVTVDYQTADGTATVGSDYRVASGTLTIPAGSRRGKITIRVIGDTHLEPNETLTVTLSMPVGATIAVPAATGTILNDD
jgi:Calx-beta domain